MAVRDQLNSAVELAEGCEMRLGPPDRKQWHDWFAWRPVYVGDQLVWLETIERRLTYSCNEGNPWTTNYWDRRLKPPAPEPLYYPND
jgi:hypothetical protein